MIEGGYRFPLLLLVLAAVCLAMTVKRLTTVLMPFTASCCHALQMLLPSHIDFWVSSAARGVTLAFLLLSTGLVARRVWRIRQFATAVHRVVGAAPAGRLADMCRRLGLEQEVVVLETPVPLAFCFGFLQPRIYRGIPGGSLVTVPNNRMNVNTRNNLVVFL